MCAQAVSKNGLIMNATYGFKTGLKTNFLVQHIAYKTGFWHVKANEKVLIIMSIVSQCSVMGRLTDQGYVSLICHGNLLRGGTPKTIP